MARITITAGTSGTTLAAQVARFGTGATAAVGAAMEGVLKGAVTDLRQEIAAAFPRSRRMPTTITGKAYPGREDGRAPTAWIHPRKGSGIGAILTAHRGATIVPADGRTALAIPTKKTPTRPRGGKLSPAEVEKQFGRKLLFVPNRRGGSAFGFLVMREARAPGRRVKGRKTRDLIMFILVPQSRLPARLRPEVILEKWVSLIPDHIDRAASVLGLGR